MKRDRADNMPMTCPHCARAVGFHDVRVGRCPARDTDLGGVGSVCWAMAVAAISIEPINIAMAKRIIRMRNKLPDFAC